MAVSLIMQTSPGRCLFDDVPTAVHVVFRTQFQSGFFPFISALTQSNEEPHGIVGITEFIPVFGCLCRREQITGGLSKVAKMLLLLLSILFVVCCWWWRSGYFAIWLVDTDRSLAVSKILFEVYTSDP